MAEQTLKPIGGAFIGQASDQHEEFKVPDTWVVFLAMSGKERAAADWMKRDHLWVYWPNFCEQTPAGQRKGTRRPQLCSMITGYLFMGVQRPEDRALRTIIDRTPGLYSYVRDASEGPALLAEQDIQIIRRIEGGLNRPFNPKTAHRFKTGEKVHFIDDLFGRWPPGKVSRLLPDGRISVEVAVLGRLVPISAFPHQIEKM